MKHRVNGKRLNWPILYPHVIGMLTLFFREFKIRGAEKIPKNHPLILTPNHQNAFMDALIMIKVFGAWRQISYLVRASIFGTKLGDFFLYRWNMLPVYREIDGKENLGKNEEIFENCIYLLEKKRILLLFPEGTHHVRKQKLPLKKGFTRIGLSAEERNNFNLDIAIVPVGVYYNRLSEFGGRVLINIGEPIYLKEYKEIFIENPNKVHTLIKSRLEPVLSDLMIDIKNSHFYECINFCREIDANEKGIKKVEADFTNSKILIEKIDCLIIADEEKAIELKSLTESYKSILKKNNFRDILFSKTYKQPTLLEKLIFVLATPIGLYGWINNYLPFKIPQKIADTKIKDEGFKSSIKLAAAMFMFPLFHFLQTIIMIFVLPEWWMVFAYEFSLPISFFPGVWWKRKLKRLSSFNRFNTIRNKEEIKNAMKQRQVIVSILNSL
jgi:1-acyl-sn-glycerol-3-phosphate acyltransferase